LKSHIKDLNDQSKCRNKPDAEPRRLIYLYEFSCVVSTAVRDGNDTQNLERRIEFRDFLYKPL